jgi:cytoskeletal protein CcmA (bactofilin family)
MKVRGRVSGEGDLRIEGQIEGDVRVSGALSIDARGSVHGNTAARSVEVEGSLTGDVSAVGSVHVRAGARVTGNITGAEIALDESAAFVGRIDADFELPDGLEGVSAAPPGVRRRR